MFKKVLIYVLLAYGITWTTILGFYFFYKHGSITKEELNVYYNIGALGPFLASIITSYIFYDQKGVKALFSHLKLSSPSKSLIALLLSPLLLMVIGLILYPILSHSFYSFNVTKEQFQLTTKLSYISWLIPFFTYAIFEEFGWRGFLLPHLQEKFNALSSTVIVWIIWACWHLPMFLFRFDFTLGITIGFFVGIFVGALILTSVFNQSNSSILAAIIFHFTNNVASALDKSYIVATVSTGFIFIAIYLLFKYGKAKLSDKDVTKNYLNRPTENIA